VQDEAQRSPVQGRAQLPKVNHREGRRALGGGGRGI